MKSSSGNTTKKVVAIGMLGVGKSTLLNCVVDLKAAGDDAAPFLAKDSAEGVTQGFRALPSTIPGVEVIDTPGLCDPDMELPVWTQRYNEQMASSPDRREVSLVVFIIPPQSRVSANEKMLAAVAHEAFQSIDAKNMVLVVNKAAPQYTAAKALANYDKMRDSVTNCSLPPLTEDRILVLPAVPYEPQPEGDIQPTIALSQRFKAFVAAHMPPGSQTVRAKQANLNAIVESSQDAAVRQEMSRMRSEWAADRARIEKEAEKRVQKAKAQEVNFGAAVAKGLAEVLLAPIKIVASLFG